MRNDFLKEQQSSINFWPSLRRLSGRLKPHRLRLTIVLFATIIGTALAALGPKILALATDTIFAGVIAKHLPAQASKEQVIIQLQQEGKDNFAAMLQKLDLIPGTGIDYAKLAWICFAAVLVFFFSNFMIWLAGILITKINQKTMYQLRADVADKLDQLPLAYFDKLPRGELLSRVTNDIDNLSQSFQQALNQLLRSVLTILAVLAMMFTISWELTLVVVVGLALAAGIAGLIAKPSQKFFAQMWKYTGEISSTVEETATGYQLIQVFGQTENQAKDFRKTTQDWRKSAFAAQFLSGIMAPVIFFATNINYVIVAVFGGLKVATGQLNLGDVQAFIQYSRQVTQPVNQLASMANLLQSGIASAERVFQVLDETEITPEQHRAELPNPIKGLVQFENVAFSYTEEPLIENLNLIAKPGQTVAIVGPTGAGKTTLVNLLMRFYEVDSGKISIDGVDITDIPRQKLRQEIGMVLQDTWLFEGTIAENIGYGKPEASLTEIQAAAKASYVDHVIQTLPQGYQTKLTDAADNISQGERQLLTIARAFLANRHILVLDEATSSVDTRIEVLVQKAMNNLRQGKTSFIIAHRLSTIRDADVIVVLEAGKIVEQGSHQELLAQKGTYYRLYQSQFAGIEI